MKEIFLLKNGELVLKGLNRKVFEDRLVKNIKYRLKEYGDFTVKKAQSTIIVTALSEDANLDDIQGELECIFGLVGICRAIVAEKNMADIEVAALALIEKTGKDSFSFKVESKRSDKAFALKSPEISAEIGARILEQNDNLRVDLHKPEITIHIEVRETAAYIHLGNGPAAGGMPLGTAGKAALMMSGGIDSPVAGYMMASRGLSLIAVHFASPPYTSEKALQKVQTLCEKLSKYSGRIKLYTVPFTRPQEEIMENCAEGYATIIMRRMMCEISEAIALKEDCGALITGESLAQVASQTMAAIACTDIASALPIFRPLIGFDKTSIVKIANKIDTYETSVLPYEDCCTVFTPKHPRTNPKLASVLFEEEKLLNKSELIAEAVSQAKSEYISAK